MYKKDLFDSETLNHYVKRIEQLTSATDAEWGKMNVSQMMAHVSNVLETSMSKEKKKRPLIGYILGPIAKSRLTSDDPFRRNLPTSSHFVITDPRNFYTERERLLKRVNEFSKGGPEIITPHPHPFFGKLTVDEWNNSQCKHLDHHLRQFGV